MATRIVEGKKPYTGGKAISIDENKVISLNLRDENNLIIYDEGDDEIYVDLQLDDEITPTSAFPIGVNTGRVIVDNGWDLAGTIISAVTTSGDNIKILYADEGTLWIDNGTGTFKQIYFKADVDALLLALRNYIDGELAKKQNGVSSDTAPSNPNEGDLWYDTTNDELKVYDGSQWTGIGGGDVLVSDQANNIFTPGMKIWGGTQSDYQSLTPDSNTAYLLLAGGPTPGGWQPGVNTLLYIPMDTASGTTDQSQYHRTYTVSGLTHTTLSGVDCYQTNGGYIDLGSGAVSWLVPATHTFTAHFWVNTPGHTSTQNVFQGAVNGSYFLGINVRNTDKIMLVGGTPGVDEWTFLSDSAISRNNWHLLSFSVGNGIDKLYVDGVLQSNTKSGGPNYGFGAWHTTSDNGIYIFADRGGDDKFIGYVGQVVMEDIERTAQEISDYYDQTKTNYGIS